MVYWDDVAMVLVRRSSVPDDLLRRREYSIVHPDDLEHVAARIAADPALRRPAALEIERVLRDDPECRLALTLKALLQDHPPG